MDPKQAPGASPTSCSGCDRPDHVQDMVACDKCEEWWHYSCAGVQQSIAERSFLCSNCDALDDTQSYSAISVTSSTSSAQLRLRQLAEAKALDDRLQLEKAEKEREYLNLKHQLELELEAEKAAGKSSVSSSTRRSRRSKVRDWVSDQNEELESTKMKLLPTATTSTPQDPASQLTDVHSKDMPVDLSINQKPTPEICVSAMDLRKQPEVPQQNILPSQTSQDQKSVHTPTGRPQHLLPPAKLSGHTEHHRPSTESVCNSDPELSGGNQLKDNLPANNPLGWNTSSGVAQPQPEPVPLVPLAQSMPQPTPVSQVALAQSQPAPVPLAQPQPVPVPQVPLAQPMPQPAPVPPFPLAQPQPQPVPVPPVPLAQPQPQPVPVPQDPLAQPQPVPVPPVPLAQPTPWHLTVPNHPLAPPIPTLFTQLPLTQPLSAPFPRLSLVQPPQPTPRPMPIPQVPLAQPQPMPQPVPVPPVPLAQPMPQPTLVSQIPLAQPQPAPVPLAQPQPQPVPVPQDPLAQPQPQPVPVPPVPLAQPQPQPVPVPPVPLAQPQPQPVPVPPVPLAQPQPQPAPIPQVPLAYLPQPMPWPASFQSGPVPQPYWPAPNPLQWSVGGTGALITAQQLAARHVVSRELPKFSGDPLEWPMFVNAFESTTAMCGIQLDENLARLQKSLVGNAREKVLSILTFPEAVPEIIATLRDECGRPEQLVHCLLAKIRNAPPPNANKLETLVTFGREVRNLVTYVEAAKLQAHLSNPMLLAELVGKLPPSLRLDWGLYSQRIPEITLKAFSDFVSSIKTAACQVSLPLDPHQAVEYLKRGKKKEKNDFVNAHCTDTSPATVQKKQETDSKPTNDPKPCTMCQVTGHKIRDCNKFGKFSLFQRWSFVEERGLCQRCLVGHGKWPCRTKQPCNANGCKEMHHKLLHPGKPQKNVPLSPPPGPSGVVTAHRHQHGSTFFKILPVILHGNGKSIRVFAFLDDGSSLTLLESSIANKLGLEGEDSPLCLQWTSDVTRRETSSKRVQLSISDAHDQKKYLLSNVRTVSHLGLPRQSLDYEGLVDQFPYLSGLPIQSYSEAVPQILVGLDNAKLKLPLRRREGQCSEPVAAKTRLGWTIFGGRQNIVGNEHVMVHKCGCSSDEDLHDLVKDYFAAESTGVAGALPPESSEDQRARRILQETTKRTESGRFETGLLWKNDKVHFPDSYQMALRRLQCLERQLAKDADLKKNITNQIIEYQERGYAHKASEQKLRESDPRRVWYLPIGVVRNPRKPKKVRVVWDAAARVGDTSLNSELLKGPDLLTPLLSVLCRFRQREYAIAGDIRQMFHQLMIKESDRQSQRFLWRTEPEVSPDVYIMDVATFGATCSPCSAQYAKNQNALEYKQQFPEAATAIIENTYVDDYLDSRDTVDEVVQLATDVREVHSKAGFEIRNWQSNSEEVLRRMGEKLSDPVKNFSMEKTTAAERVLGIAWMPSEDVFTFAVQFREELKPLLSGETVPTKRQVLQIVMSFFDPLGLVTAYTIHGRIIIQDVWRSGVSWDEPISSADFANWQRWIKLAPALNEVRIPRCYFPGYAPDSFDRLQLHVLVDASEKAYCCVAYFRICDRGTPRCALVAAKAKVTPLKPQSIPRNELNAAVLGVRLSKTIAESHSISITQRYFWTDSTTVLAWLRADPRNYRQYVAFRVAEILSESDAAEWNWVPTRLNIADEGTKWGDGPKINSSSKWFNGPDFLHSAEEEWPARKQNFSEPTEELRAVNVHQEVTSDKLLNLSEYSSWKDLLNRFAYLYHFVHQCQSTNRIRCAETLVQLTQRDYEAAEKGIWRMVQPEAYAKELDCLRAKKRLNASSPLAKLSPFLDCDGLVRMESRIHPDAACYRYDFRNPVIIPRQSHVAKLLVLHYHQRYGHANTETVLNELRQKYYVAKMRTVVRKIIGECMWCRVYRAKPAEPKMAPLPLPRVTPYVRPFTFTGLDYFGPLLVKRGRGVVKRWVALFTCLTVRAVHLEVVHSLTTTSCKMAIQRFVRYRGAPQHIFSDNGTCFRGAARELAEEVKAINRQIAGTFTNADTEFNPPSAPHMGGVWERKVRSVKEALKVAVQTVHLDDEELLTFLADAEMIVNSHPLTFVPLESPENEVLTPNNFLMMSSSGCNTSSRIPVDKKVNLRMNWKLMQGILNEFWKTWIKEYLPVIARRTKWFESPRPLQEGDLVVIVDETVRNGWLRGRVEKVYKGRDDQVRKVDVRTSAGVVQRPAVKVALLDLVDDSKAD